MLNCWEHLIRSIKIEIRKIQRIEKLIALMIIKQVVEKPNQDDQKILWTGIKETQWFIKSKTS